MHCTCCGAPVEPEDAFCPACGARLDARPAEEAAAQPPVQPAGETPAQSSPPPTSAGVRPPRKKPPVALRVLMQLLSLVLCFALLGTAIGAVLLLDLRSLTSAGGMEKLIFSVFSVSSAPVRSPAVQAPASVSACAARFSDAPQVQLLSSRTADDPEEDTLQIIYGNDTLQFIYGDPEFTPVTQNPDGSYCVAMKDGTEFYLWLLGDGSCTVETPDGVPFYVTPDGMVLDHLGEKTQWPFGENIRLTYDPALDGGSDRPDDGGNNDPIGSEDVSGALNSYIFRYYDQIQSQYGSDLPVTRQQLQAILEQPSVQSFLSKKVSEYVQDILTGSENASISADEIMELLEENRQLLEDEWNFTLTPEEEQQLRQQLTTALDEQNLSGQLRENISGQIEAALSGGSSDTSSTNDPSGTGTLRLIQTVFSRLLSTRTLLITLAACLVLLALLCLTNWYNVPAGLTWAGVACTFGGLIMTVPLLILRGHPDFLLLTPGTGVRPLMQVLQSFADVVLPVHCTLLLSGLLLLIVSIVWRVVRARCRAQNAQ